MGSNESAHGISNLGSYFATNMGTYEFANFSANMGSNQSTD